jgi:serine/threonine protein phosphatase PrpC
LYTFFKKEIIYTMPNYTTAIVPYQHTALHIQSQAAVFSLLERQKDHHEVLRAILTQLITSGWPLSLKNGYRNAFQRRVVTTLPLASISTATLYSHLITPQQLRLLKKVARMREKYVSFNTPRYIDAIDYPICPNPKAAKREMQKTLAAAKKQQRDHEASFHSSLTPDVQDEIQKLIAKEETLLTELPTLRKEAAAAKEKYDYFLEGQKEVALEKKDSYSQFICENIGVDLLTKLQTTEYHREHQEKIGHYLYGKTIEKETPYETRMFVTLATMIHHIQGFGHYGTPETIDALSSSIEKFIAHIKETKAVPLKGSKDFESYYAPISEAYNTFKDEYRSYKSSEDERKELCNIKSSAVTSCCEAERNLRATQKALLVSYSSGSVFSSKALEMLQTTASKEEKGSRSFIEKNRGYYSQYNADWRYPMNTPITSSTTETTGWASCGGRRLLDDKGMEDAHIEQAFSFKSDGDDIPARLIGVFDGHGGAKCSEWIKNHITKYLQEHLSHFTEEELSQDNILEAIKVTCTNLNRKLPRYIKDGTTACFAVIIEGKLYIANIGDSRALLVTKDGETIQITRDASFSEEHYRKRAEKRGGVVGDLIEYQRNFYKEDYDRYPHHPGLKVLFAEPHTPQYALANLRKESFISPAGALGDHDFPGTCYVPEVGCIPLDSLPPDTFLTIFCDGIPEGAHTSREVGSFLSMRMRQRSSAAAVAADITKLALDAGSEDNISVAITKVT